MEALLRKEGEPLYALESLDPIRDFDFIAVHLAVRDELHRRAQHAGPGRGAGAGKGAHRPVADWWPAGGPCACNPEPLADFVDLFILGEGEEVNLEIIDLYMQAKKEGWDKQRILEAKPRRSAASMCPSLYDVSYNADGTIACRHRQLPGGARQGHESASSRIWTRCSSRRSLWCRLSTSSTTARCWNCMRGCIRGCRFCQAGFIYRPAARKALRYLKP